MKRLLSAILALAVILSLSLGIVPAGAVGATTGEVDVVFLVDSSRSMAKSDPDMIRLEAIKLFSDLCTLGSTKIGFVLFGSDINYAQEPVPINTEADRADIKKTVDGLDELKGTTDIGKAMLYAVDMLKKDAYQGNGKFIVFLSDGKTVITNESGGRTKEDSKADLEKAITDAKAAEIPVYTIGLNANGDVDEEELRYISASTYADDTYMTVSASDLSEILSDIYVRHTGAESYSLSSYTSIGGYHDTEFEIADGSVVAANLVIMHSGKLDDMKIYDGEGTEVKLGSESADLSENGDYALIKLYYPKPGKWKLSISSAEDTNVNINYILTRDYRLAFTIFTDKEVGAGTRLKLIASLTAPDGTQIEDENVLSKLVGQVIVRNTVTGDSVDVPLEREEFAFKGEYVLETADMYSVQASIFNANTDIRSEITELEPGSEEYKEPEGPLKFILIIGGSVLLVVLIIVLIRKYTTNHIRMWSGRLVLSVNVGGMPAMPMPYDFAKRIPGKRKVVLYNILKDLSADADLTEAIPRSMTTAITMSMTESGELRVKKVNGPEYNGGVTLGKNVILSNGNKLTLRYKDFALDVMNSIVIQYLRT